MKMNFDDVGRIWRDQDTGEFLRTRIEDLSSARDRAAETALKVRRRDARENIAAVLIVVLTVVLGVRIHSVDPEAWSRLSPISWLGVTLIYIGLAISLVSRRMARRTEPDLDVPIDLALQAEVDRLRAQERFFGGAPWHYGPAITGALLAIAGAPGLPVRVRTVQVLVVMVIVAVVSWYSYNGRRRFRPLRLELESWLADLKDFDRS
jgi:hypothetical protein